MWVGNPTKDVKMRYISIGGRPSQIIYGGTIAAPTWKTFMDTALKGKAIKKFPSPDYSLVGRAAVIKTSSSQTKSDSSDSGSKKSTGNSSDKKD